MSSHDALQPPPPRPAAALSRRALLRLGRPRTARADLATLTARVAAGWERTPHDDLLRALAPAAAHAAGLAAPEPGERVLDAAAAAGNVAAACAARGAAVHACDLAAGMVARGRARTGPAVAWRRADVQDLPYPDAAFDVVISTFGAVLAPHATRTARELARVLAPGGRLVLAAWSPRGLPGRLDELLAPALPLPDGVLPPSAWAVPARARARLAPHFAELKTHARSVRLALGSPDGLFEALLAPSGLDAAALARVRPGFDRLLAAQENRPGAGEIDARYVVHVARRPA